ncbi:MAG TPA: glycosyltransferase family 4 protein [Bryobacteraceae bacterium]|nr:glycosyltransferase family 4 protein [Bryobacteraceae bacterium]
MRVLVLDQFAELGGAQRCLLETVSALGEAGWEVHAALPGPGPLARLLEARVASVHRLDLGSYSLGTKSVADVVRYSARLGVLARQIRALARRTGADLLYVNGPRLLPPAACAELQLPVIFHCHNPIGSLAPRVLTAWAVRKTNATVIAAGNRLARQWRGAVHVVYGGVGGPPPGWERHGGSVGMIARFHPRKGQREFVTAAAQVAAELPEARFLLCGDAVFEDRLGLRYRAEVLSCLPPSVRYLGWRDDVYEVLAACDLLVLPSREEGGVPYVILEAFAARVPVLATPAGGIPEVIEDGRTGFLLSRPDAAGIARRLRELLPQPAVLSEVAERAWQLWRERFTAEEYRRRLAALLARCCSAAARRG